MKNKYFSFVALAAAAFVTSCSNDDLATEAGRSLSETKSVTLEASIVGNDTRVGLGRTDDGVKLYWHAGDQISVMTVDNTYNYANTGFKIADGTETGVTKATFNGTLKSGYNVGGYAFYPYNEKHSFASGSLLYNLPDSYDYGTVYGNIFPKTADETTSYPTNSIRMPMLGTITDGKVAFTNLGGVLVIRFDSMPAESGTFTVSADQVLCGDFTITYLDGYQMSATSASTQTSVTFNYEGATAGSAGVFYLPVPPKSYTGLKITVGDKTAEYGSLKVSSADIITIPVYQGTDGASYSCTYEADGHKFINLCLPSGTLWAETNVGATEATGYGNYYAWVNTSSAISTWGSYCRMPTIEELAELFNTANCTFAWDTQTNSSGQSINGYTFTSKKNGNSIFLPAAGYGYTYSDSHPEVGSWGYYFSSTMGTSNDRGKAYYFKSDAYAQQSALSTSCYSVRPIIGK